MPFNNSDWDAIAQEMCFENEKDMLTTLYERSSISEIATLLKCGTATVQRRLTMYHIKKRARGGSNNSGLQKYKMFHVDQRVLMFMGLTYAAKYFRVAPSTIYKYKRHKMGGKNTSSRAFNGEKGEEA